MPHAQLYTPLLKELKEEQALKFSAVAKERDQERSGYQDILAELASLDRVAGVKELHKKLLPLLSHLNRSRDQERPRKGVIDKENWNANEQPAPFRTRGSDQAESEGKGGAPSSTAQPTLAGPKQSAQQQPQRLATPTLFRVPLAGGVLASNSGECRHSSRGGAPRRSLVGQGLEEGGSVAAGGRYSGALTSKCSGQGGYKSAPTTPLCSPRVGAGPAGIKLLNAPAICEVLSMRSLPRAALLWKGECNALQ